MELDADIQYEVIELMKQHIVDYCEVEWTFDNIRSNDDYKHIMCNDMIEMYDMALGEIAEKEGLNDWNNLKHNVSSGDFTW